MVLIFNIGNKQIFRKLQNVYYFYNDKEKQNMKDRERFKRLMNFNEVDRLPIVEWAGWWDKTIKRWHTEGLPTNLKDDGEIRAYFNFDTWRQCWIEPRKTSMPKNHQNYKPLVINMDSYNKIKEHLYPQTTSNVIGFDKKNNF